MTHRRTKHRTRRDLNGLLPVGRGHHQLRPAWVRNCQDFEQWRYQLHSCWAAPLQLGPRKPHFVDHGPSTPVLHGPLWCVATDSAAAKPDGPAMQVHGRWMPSFWAMRSFYGRLHDRLTRERRLRQQRWRIRERTGRTECFPF